MRKVSIRIQIYDQIRSRTSVECFVGARVYRVEDAIFIRIFVRTQANVQNGINR